MILKSFQVRKYKNVRCSGEVTLDDDATCLVGKNESGKSALLQALYRLNPVPTGHPDTFVALRDYPRRHYAQERGRVPAIRPITATFELGDEDLRTVEEVHGRGVLDSRLVTVSRTYENELVVEFDRAEGGYAETEGEGDEDEFGRAAWQEIEGADALLAELPSAGGRTDLRPHPPPSLDGRTSRTGIRQTIEGLLPSFLLFDEYSVMSGRVSIPRLQTGDGSALTPSERTTLALVQLADMDLTDFTRDGYEARKASLEAAANQLTEEVFTYWSQNRSLSVEFDVDFDRTPEGDGPFFELRIRNHRHGITLNFSERSHGFTWFFSFLATLSELRDSKRMILLLDEPGLGLHASAQGDLLRFIDERLTRRHQVVYSTHSPFMVASGGLERVRTVEDRDGEGTRVSREFLDHSSDTRIPLQAAFGHELIRVLPTGPGTLLVRGPSDHVYLTAMSGHLEAQGRSYLDPRWTIVPVGGLAGVSAFVGLLGTRSNVAVMADVGGGGGGGGCGSTDSPAGRRMLAENGIVRPADFMSRNARGEASGADDPDDDASGRVAADAGDDDTARSNGTSDAGPDIDNRIEEGGGADIEDLFAEDFYVDLVNRSGAASIEAFEIHGEGRIVRRIEAATGLGLDRYLPARLLLDTRVDPLEGVDEATYDRFESLFMKINSLLRREKSRDGGFHPDGRT